MTTMATTTYQPWQDINDSSKGYMTLTRRQLNKSLQDITERAFRAWVNNELTRSNKISSPLGHLGTSFSGPYGGLNLIRLFETLLKVPADPNVWKYHDSPRNSWEGLENFEIAFDFFNRYKPNDFEVSPSGAHMADRHKFMYSTQELYEGNLKMILGMIFELIDFFTIRPIVGRGNVPGQRGANWTANDQRRVQDYWDNLWGTTTHPTLNDGEKEQFFYETFGFHPVKHDFGTQAKGGPFYEESHTSQFSPKKKKVRKPIPTVSTAPTSAPHVTISEPTEHYAAKPRSPEHFAAKPRSPEHFTTQARGGSPEQYSSFMKEKDQVSGDIKHRVDKYRTDLESERSISEDKFRQFQDISDRLRESIDRLSNTTTTQAREAQQMKSTQKEKELKKEIVRLRAEMNNLMKQFSGSMDERNLAIQREMDRLKYSFDRLNSNISEMSAAPRGVQDERLIEEVNRAKKDLHKDKKLLETLAEENRRLVEENRRRNADIESISRNLQDKLWELEHTKLPGEVTREAGGSRRASYGTIGHESPHRHYPGEAYDLARSMPAERPRQRHAELDLEPSRHYQHHGEYPRGAYGDVRPSVPVAAEIYGTGPAHTIPTAGPWEDLPPEYFDRTPTYTYKHKPKSKAKTKAKTEAKTKAAHTKPVIKKEAEKSKEKAKEKLAEPKKRSLSDAAYHKKKELHQKELENRVDKLEHKLHKYKGEHKHKHVTVRRSASLPSMTPTITTRDVPYYGGHHMGTITVTPFEVNGLGNKVKKPIFDVSLSSQVFGMSYPFGTVGKVEGTSTTGISSGVTPLVFNVSNQGQLLVIDVLNKTALGKRVYGRTVVPMNFIRKDDAKASLDGWFPIEAAWSGGSRSVRKRGDKWYVRNWLNSKDGKRYATDEHGLDEQIRRNIKDLTVTGNVADKDRGSIRLRIEFNRLMNRPRTLTSTVGPSTRIVEQQPYERVVERRLIEEEIIEPVRHRKYSKGGRDKEVIVEREVSGNYYTPSGYGETVVTREPYIKGAKTVPSLVRTSEVVRPDF